MAGRDIDKEVGDMQGTGAAVTVGAPYPAPAGPYQANFGGANKIVAKKRGDYSDTGTFAGGVPAKGSHYENGKKK